MRFAGVRERIANIRPSTFEGVKAAHMNTESESKRFFIQFAFVIWSVFWLFITLMVCITLYYSIKQVAGVTDAEVDIACAENGGKWESLPGADDVFACNTSD